jgi:two-component system NtrC family sensor kinase
VKPIKRKPKRSLRTILVVWFLIFSLLPLAFVTGYSVLKYEVAIDNELFLRLNGNAREVEVVLSDFRNNLIAKKEKYLRDASLVYHLSVGDISALKNQSSEWLKIDPVNNLSFFNREGRLLISVFKDDKNSIRHFSPGMQAVFLTERSISFLKNNKEIGLIEYSSNNKTSILMISKVLNTSGKTVGYFEQIIDLDQAFLNRLKNRLKLEVIILKENGQVVNSSNPLLAKSNEDFAGFVKNKSNQLLEIPIQGVPFGFYFEKMSWGESQFFVALGASKSDAKAALKNVNIAFISVVTAVIFLLVITILVTSRLVLKPLDDLVEALESFEIQEQAVTIPVKTDTEIGLLTESFNQMSFKITQARVDLKKKISELEQANKEIKEAQSKLVHSSKMISLGQLVAGVAHELNNPISFIYSNMTHLKEYSEKLTQLIEVAEKSPDELSFKKEEFDFEYIKKDLPKLISSCQEGARRTRDIVLGLRNFSRLDESLVKEIDVHQSIDNTLDLLQGQIKNRVQVHKAFEPAPLIHCYASQINQVIMNIMSNALQAMPETGGSLWISTQILKPPQVLFESIQISIQDNGKGMSPETLEKIFDPFFTTKGVGQGTGLGLSISYGIVHNHGGDIQVKSQPGVGTEFIIVLPLKMQNKSV